MISKRIITNYSYTAKLIIDKSKTYVAVIRERIYTKKTVKIYYSLFRRNFFLSNN